MSKSTFCWIFRQAEARPSENQSPLTVRIIWTSKMLLTVNYDPTKGALKVLFISSFCSHIDFYFCSLYLIKAFTSGNNVRIKVQKWISNRAVQARKEQLTFPSSWLNSLLVSYKLPTIHAPRTQTSAWVSQIFQMFTSLLYYSTCMIYWKFDNFALLVLQYFKNYS